MNKPRRLLGKYDIDTKSKQKPSLRLAEDFKEYWEADNGPEKIMKVEMTEHYFFSLYDSIRNLENS